MRVLPNLIDNSKEFINLGSCWVSIYKELYFESFAFSHAVACVCGSMMSGILFCNVSIWLFSMESWSFGRPLVIYWSVNA
jgi:hypothetical protein